MVLVGGGILMGMPLFVSAAGLTWNADTPLSIGTLTGMMVQGGSRATSMTVNNDGTISVTVGASESFTVRSTTRRMMTANPSVTEGTCTPTENDYIVQGPATTVITVQDAACTKGSSGGGSGSSSATTTSAPVTITPTQKTPTTPTVAPTEKKEEAAKPSVVAPKEAPKETAKPTTDERRVSAPQAIIETKVEVGEDLKILDEKKAKGFSAVRRTLIKGTRGTDVRALQEALRAQGEELKVTGVFDDATVKAVKSFQIELGLVSEKDKTAGVVGAQTRDVINEILGKNSEALNKAAQAAVGKLETTSVKADATFAKTVTAVATIEKRADALDDLVEAASRAKAANDKTKTTQAVIKNVLELQKNLTATTALLTALTRDATGLEQQVKALSLHRIRDAEERAEARTAQENVKKASVALAKSVSLIKKKNAEIIRDLARLRKNSKDVKAAKRIAQATKVVQQETGRADGTSQLLKEYSAKLKEVVADAFGPSKEDSSDEDEE